MRQCSKVTGRILISGAVLSVGVAPGRRRLGGFCLNHKLKLAPPRKTLSKLVGQPGVQKCRQDWCENHVFEIVVSRGELNDKLVPQSDAGNMLKSSMG